MKKAIFLDRDGILNKPIIIKGKPYAPTIIKDFTINYKFLTVTKYLKSLNYLLIMVTNQPDVNKKIITKKFINEINNKLKKYFLLDDIYTCFSANDKNFRRKPNPGMLFEAQQKWDINMQKSYMIGDRKKDIDAGVRAGVKTIFLDKGYKETKPNNFNFKIKSLKKIIFLVKK